MAAEGQFPKSTAEFADNLAIALPLASYYLKVRCGLQILYLFIFTPLRKRRRKKFYAETNRSRVSFSIPIFFTVLTATY